MTARSSREDGAYLVLYALLGVAFFTMAAVILDIAALRQGRRVDRTAADLAATAGVAELDPTDASSPAAACSAAWGYVLANRDGVGGALTAPPCTTVFTPSTCTSTTSARTATGTIGAMTVEITHPVPNGSPLMLAEAPTGDRPQATNPVVDGVLCERLAVRIVRSRTFLFGGLMGQAAGSTDVHSVARVLTSSSTTEVPGIVALEPSGCDAVLVDPGGGSLRVGSTTEPGLIAVDSDGTTCAAPGHTITPGVAGDPADRIQAITTSSGTPGRIRSHALAGASFARAYDPAAVSDGRLDPQPLPAAGRTGRSLIDVRYDCASCGGPTHITQLRAARAGATAPTGSVDPPVPCTIPTGPPQQFAGHVYVNCDPFVVQGNVTFLGDAVTFAGAVEIQDGGCLAVNDATCNGSGITPQDVAIYVRGPFTKAIKGRMILPRTFVYAEGPLQVGSDTDLLGGSAISWTAPTGGPFEDLVFWSDSPGDMLLGEQVTNIVEGTFFAPNARVTVAGRPGGSGASVAMQLVARRVRLADTFIYQLRPTVDRATGRLVRQVRLIR